MRGPIRMPTWRQVEDGADDCTDCQTRHTQARCQHEGAQGNAQWIERRCQGRQQKMFEAVQDAALYRADGEDDHRQQHDAHDGHRFGLLRGVEAGGNQVGHQPGCCQADQDAQKADDDHDQVGNGTGQPPRAGAVVPGEEGGEDRDEGGGQRTTGHDGEQQVGQAESGVVGIKVGADAKLVGDDDVAQESGQCCQAKGRGDDQRIAREVCQARGRRFRGDHRWGVSHAPTGHAARRRRR